MRSRRNIPFNTSVVAALGGLFLLGATACSRSKESRAAVRVPVVVEIAQTTTLTRPLIFFAQTQPVADSQLAFNQTGVVDTVSVEEGQLVEQGSLLAQLDKESLRLDLSLSRARLSEAAVAYKKVRRGYRKEIISQFFAAYKQAQANLARARRSFESAKELWESKTISENQYVQAKTSFDAAKAALERAKQAYEEKLRGYEKADVERAGARTSQAATQVKLAKKRLADSELRAPFTGVVAKKMVEVGELVGPQTPAIQMVDLRRVEVQFGVPERVIGSISMGQKVDIYAPARRARAPGEVVRKGVVLEKSTLTYPVTVLVENPVVSREGNRPAYEFLPGNVVAVVFQCPCPEGERGISVPLTAVLDRGRQKHVYVIRKGKAFRKTVEVGRIFRNRVVIEGIEAGDEVVVEGQHQLSPGQPIYLVARRKAEDAMFELSSPFLEQER
jgi:RND family efflux transporter MFP subunit